MMLFKRRLSRNQRHCRRCSNQEVGWRIDSQQEERSVKNFLANIGLLLTAILPAQAQDAGPKVHARLVAEDSAVPPGGTITVALEENIRAGWHTYWINPGDAGAATEIKWTLPQGWSAGADPVAHAQAPAGRAADGLRL